MLRIAIAFVRFDNWLLDRVFQPLVNWLGRNFGITRTAAGEFLLSGALICWIGWTWLFATLQTNPIYMGMFFFMGTLVGLAWGLMFWGAMFTARRQPYTRRLALLPMRLSSWLAALPNIIPFSFAELFDTLAFVFAITGAYILSCDDGPRKRERRSRMVEQGI